MCIYERGCRVGFVYLTEILLPIYLPLTLQDTACTLFSAYYCFVLSPSAADWCSPAIVMSNDDDSVYNALLATAAVPFYRCVARLAINYVLRGALDSDVNKEPNPQLYFRPDIVTDATLAPPAKVPNSAQRLVRWDRRAPLHIFTHGFRPNAPPRPPSHKDAVTDVAFANTLHNEGAFDLEGYAAHDERNSVFVSATEPYVNRAGEDPMVWCPDFRGPEHVYFMYEIFAYGGFYVGRVLANNPHAREREVAFIGGIRPELISFSV